MNSATNFHFIIDFIFYNLNSRKNKFYYTCNKITKKYDKLKENYINLIKGFHKNKERISAQKGNYKFIKEVLTLDNFSLDLISRN